MVYFSLFLSLCHAQGTPLLSQADFLARPWTRAKHANSTAMRACSNLCRKLFMYVAVIHNLSQVWKLLFTIAHFLCTSHLWFTSILSKLLVLVVAFSSPSAPHSPLLYCKRRGRTWDITETGIDTGPNRNRRGIPQTIISHSTFLCLSSNSKYNTCITLLYCQTHT